MERCVINVVVATVGGGPEVKLVVVQADRGVLSLTNTQQPETAPQRGQQRDDEEASYTCVCLSVCEAVRRTAVFGRPEQNASGVALTPEALRQLHFAFVRTQHIRDTCSDHRRSAGSAWYQVLCSNMPLFQLFVYCSAASHTHTFATDSRLTDGPAQPVVEQQPTWSVGPCVCLSVSVSSAFTPTASEQHPYEARLLPLQALVLSRFVAVDHRKSYHRGSLSAT
ncbi:unnamed protein product [Soboliphyme baturini]|uniref:Uncharacterized protein n=1 Tax=Soboliphyme baturini TaxID=241478 RepID=A0A183IG45_9BILA|nr:unnamed protein product [Soboliphyme baturini]